MRSREPSYAHSSLEERRAAQTAVELPRERGCTKIDETEQGQCRSEGESEELVRSGAGGKEYEMREREPGLAGSLEAGEPGRRATQPQAPSRYPYLLTSVVAIVKEGGGWSVLYLQPEGGAALEPAAIAPARRFPAAGNNSPDYSGAPTERRRAG